MSSGSPGTDYVTDTMALVLRLEKRKMGKESKYAFEIMEQGNGTIRFQRWSSPRFFIFQKKKESRSILRT
jgi:hypothetical protein